MENTSPKPFVFVVMPFHEDFKEIYELGIKQACLDAGAYCERVDEQLFNEAIHDRVNNQIAKADVIIADMTGRNPNVFYEVGYAHALNKQVILLTQKAEDIPFDLKHYPHIIYSGKILSLKPQLEAKLRWCIDNPKISLASVGSIFEFYVNNILIIDCPSVRTKCLQPRNRSIPNYYEFGLSLHLHNISSSRTSTKAFVLYLVTPQLLTLTNDSYQNIVLLDSQVLPTNDVTTRMLIKRKLFPDEWVETDINCKFNIDDPLMVTRTVKMQISLHTEVGRQDYPLILEIEPPKPKEIEPPKPTPMGGIPF